MMLKVLLVTFCLALPITLAAGEPTKLREIDAKDLHVEFEKGRWNMPKTIASAEEFDKALPGADA